MIRTLTQEERRELLLTLRSDAGHAERAGGRTAQDYYPVSEHLRAFDPDISLIVGDRGAGKSQLVAVARDPVLRRAALDYVHRARPLPVSEPDAAWRTGYPFDYGPAPSGPERFALEHFHDIESAAQDFWLAYLVRTLADLLVGPGGDNESLRSLVSAPAIDVEGRVGDLLKAGTEPLVALDELDRRLVTADDWIFVSYDDLDQIHASDRWAMGALIRGLITFWSSYHRRWKRIRPKLFLRADLYKRHVGAMSGTGVAKLATSRVNLTWSDKNLYAALVKHVANLSPAWLSYLAEGARGGVRFEHDAVLGAVPVAAGREDLRPLIERMVGTTMGRKGLLFQWILDHLRDGNGKVSPRSLVFLFESAAVIELREPRAGGPHVLSSLSVREAVDRVSEAHVLQSNDEPRWLPQVKGRMRQCPEVPWESRATLEAALGIDWEVWMTLEGERGPPAASPEGVFDVLVELGIVRDRGNGTYDVPDLYLAGLGLKRKGGVAKGARRAAR